MMKFIVTIYLQRHLDPGGQYVCQTKSDDENIFPEEIYFERVQKL